MNYARLWKLKARARWLIGAAFCSGGALIVAPFLSLASSGNARLTWLWFGLLVAASGAVALVGLGVTFREIDRLERDDLEHKPWRSQPRGDRCYNDQGGGA